MNKFTFFTSLILAILLITTEKLSAQNWDLIIKTCASDRAEYDYLGHSVSISGDYAIVGAYREDEDANGENTEGNSGSAYIFKNNNGTWSQIKKICASDRAGFNYFGYSVSISGDYAIIGAKLEDEDVNGENTAGNSGAAYIFKKDQGGIDNWGEVQKICALDRTTQDEFGSSVCISGDYAIVGATGEDEDANGENTINYAGSAYIFKNNNGTWSQIKKICASDRAEFDYFGKSVSISGDYAIIGAFWEDEDVNGEHTANNSGAAYIFKKDQGGIDNWGEVQKICASDRAEYDYFGESISISGDYAIVGATGEDEDANEENYLGSAGSAYIFKNISGTWSQIKKICASDREASANFGYSVSISDDFAIVGANREKKDANGDNILSNAGAAYIFKKNQGGIDNWGEVQKISAPERAVNDYFGFSVSISGNYAMVGAYGEDEDANDENFVNFAGSAYLFKRSLFIWDGSENTEWNNNANWEENAAPSANDDVLIPSGLTNYPIIDNTLGSPASCQDIKINSNGELSISSNERLTITGNLDNNGVVNIESSSTGEGSLIVEGILSGTGTYNVERYLSGSQWHLVTSPITNGVAGVFQDIWLRAYDEATNSFDEYIVPYTTPMPTGQGFSVWADAAETRTFTGIINHGAVGPLSAQLTGAAGANTGWNLMGNPYPSAIDWDASSGWTKSNLANSVYVWNSTQYATFVAGVGNNGGSRYIAPGQGFFVQATSSGASLSMDNDIRVHNSVSFLKNSQSDPDNTIRVTISADGYQDENVIVIRDANTNAFDPQVDAYKLPGSADAPQMHIEKDDFSELSIASFPQIQDIENKALNIDYAIEGTHTLLWSHTCTENTPALLDQQTGQIIEPDSNYTFTASFSDMQDRFVFTTDLLSIQDKINTLDVWEYNNTVFVKSNTENSKISVFNMQGVEVYSNTGNEFNLNHLASAMYLVKVKSGENHKIQKIVIK